MRFKCLVGMFCVLAISSPVISDDSANKNPEESAADGVGKRAASDHSFPQKLMQIFQPGQTATLYSTTTGYNIRLVTDEQRKKVAKTIADYRKIRAENIEDEMFVNRVTTAYRTLASDLRLGRYYKIVVAGSDYVELKNDEVQVVVPKSSIQLVLRGTGSLPTLRSGRSGGFPGGRGGGALDGRGGRGGGDRGAGRGGNIGGPAPEEVIRELLGRGGRRNADGDRAAGRIFNVFYLRHITTDLAMKAVNAEFEDMKVTADPRLNALIVFGNEESVKKLKEFIEKLDKK